MSVTKITQNKRTLKTKEAAAKPSVVDYANSAMVVKTVRMAEVMKKYPRPQHQGNCKALAGN